MDGDVGRVRTERIYTLPSGGRGGRRPNSEDARGFRLDGEGEEPNSEPANQPEHGSVGHPDDDEAGRRIDITG
ncbi:MAG: hypothetical protein H6831_11485 [Planctomycetes bacterium]|nr:hypothetical protein [Planctomycetota bacterium]MCB9905022.1 hypothetical protein [Planctomycetota bacterium]